MALWSIGCYGKNLKFEDISIFSVSRTRGIAGIAVLDNRLHYTAPRGVNLYSAVIDRKAPYPDLVVRGTKEPDFSADRWQFSQDGNKSAATAIARYPKWPAGAVLVDGRHMQLRFIELTKPSHQAQGDLIVDRIRPAADPRGEAPRSEMLALRRRFVNGAKARLKTGQTIVTGMSFYRQQGKKSHYLATTAVPGFPLVTVSCALTSSFYCKVDRSCLLPVSFPNGKVPVGVGYHSRGKTLVVADRDSVYKLKMNSCFDIRRRGKLKPPAKIRRLTSLAVDAERKLWLGTEGLDDYHAANIYAWPEPKW